MFGRYRSRLAAIAGAIVVVAAMLSSPAAMADSGVEIGPDTRDYAISQGIPLEAAEQVMAWQDDFNGAVMKISMTYPNQYAGARIELESLTGHVQFVGRVPVDARRMLESLEHEVVITEDAKLSRRDLDDAVAKAYFTVYERRDVKNASASYEEASRSIIINVDWQADAEPLRSNAAARLLEESLSNSIGLPVEINSVRNAGALDVTIRGGAIFQNSSGDLKCTPGFTVENFSTGAKGVAAADHCANAGPSFQYKNPGSSATTTLSFHSSVASNGWDAAWWHGGSNTIAKTFYRSANTLQTQTSWSDATLGSTVSNYGRKTGASPNRVVVATGACGNGYCGLTAVNGVVTEPGDSGGPWFQNGTAYGIQSGRIQVAGGFRSAFSPVIRLYAINVVVYT